MRNRAKCKLCDCTIESIVNYVACECGEIAVSGGLAMKCHAKDFANFVRIDDEDNEVEVKVIDNVEKEIEEKITRPSKEELVSMLDEMIISYDNLPQSAMLAPITNYDFSSLLLLLSALFKEKRVT